MKSIKKMAFLGIGVLITFSILVLVSCAAEIASVADDLRQTGSSQAATEQIEQSVIITNTPATTIAVKNTIAKTTTPTDTTAITTTTLTTTTFEPKNVFIPVRGIEVNNWVPTYNSDKWAILKFDYDVIHEPETDYHFPWSFTIKNKTETNLKLTAYIIHWGYHNSIGYLSETPFILEAGGTKNFSGEDVLDEMFYEEMLFLEDILIDIYIAEG